MIPPWIIISALCLSHRAYRWEENGSGSLGDEVQWRVSLPCTPHICGPRGVTSWMRLFREEAWDEDEGETLWKCPPEWLSSACRSLEYSPLGLWGEQNLSGLAWPLTSSRSHICTSCCGFWGEAWEDPLCPIPLVSHFVDSRLPESSLFMLVVWPWADYCPPTPTPAGTFLSGQQDNMNCLQGSV